MKELTSDPTVTFIIFFIGGIVAIGIIAWIINHYYEKNNKKGKVKTIDRDIRSFSEDYKDSYFTDHK